MSAGASAPTPMIAASSHAKAEPRPAGGTPSAMYAKEVARKTKKPPPKPLEMLKTRSHHHGNEHDAFNHFMESKGVPTRKVDEFVNRGMRFMAKHLSPQRQLAKTCALEHFTAIMANQVLTNPDATAGMHPQFKELWRWHAIEETEHKAVAYDVYQQAVGRYWLRVLTMINVTFFFCLRTSIYQTIFLWKDGQLFNPKTWWQGIRFYFIRPALVRRIMRQYLDYFRRDFHPWMHDNRELVQHWLTEEQSFKTL